jgi:hypothetical protein
MAQPTWHDDPRRPFRYFRGFLQKRKKKAAGIGRELQLALQHACFQGGKTGVSLKSSSHGTALMNIGHEWHSGFRLTPSARGIS